MVSGRRSYSGPAVNGAGPLPPVSSKAKDYTERPEEVVDELDELRVRGIAKVLNKHFTTTTKQLAIEKAEADAALADLERRRAQTKAFVPSKGGQLNPYDQLYLQLQQKRAECRRKERETMLLYQRYVMKYGKSAKADPLISATPSDSNGPQQLKAPNSPSKGDPPGKSGLSTLDENSEITFSKFYDKQREKQELERIKRENSEKSAKHFMSALNKFMADEDETDDLHQANGVPELVPSKDSCQPSPASSNGKLDPFMSALSRFKEGQESPAMVATNDDDEDDDEQQVQNVIHRVAADAAEPKEDNDLLVIKRTPSEDPPGKGGTECVPEDESIVSEQRDRSNEKSLPTLQKTAPNGYTTIAKTETAIPPATPDIVPAVGQATLSPVTNQSTPKSGKFDVNDIEGFDFDDRSIISELTLANSAVTRQVLDEVEMEMDDFIQSEMQAIRKMLDSEEDASTVDPSFNEDQSEASSLVLADQSVKVAMKAEAMAREMQKILDDFAKEDAMSVAEGSTSGANESVQSPEKQSNSAEPASVYPYKFEPAIPGEEWYVHFDDNYQKEFYVERRSNRTQWDYPQKVPSPQREERPVSADDFLSDMHSVASSRRSLSRRSSRRSIYRKQRKRRRARRLMISFLALLCVLVSVFCWRIKHPGESITVALTTFAVGLRDMSIEDFVNLVIDQYEYSFTDRKAREEESRRLQQEQKAKELAARLAAERAAKLAREDSQREKEEAERIANQKAAKAAREREEAARVARELAAKRAKEEREERERLALLEAEAKAKAEEEAKKVEVKKARRNFGCNIPFAYVVPYCWRLAKSNPIFGLKNENDLVFLQ